MDYEFAPNSPSPYRPCLNTPIYFLGRYLNKRINQNFLFFVTTHALYKYKTNRYEYVKNKFNNRDIDLLKEAIEFRQCKVIRSDLTEDDRRRRQWRHWLRSSFDDPLRTYILIETVPHARSLWHHLTNKDDSF